MLIQRKQAEIELLHFFSVGRFCRKFKGKLFLSQLFLRCIVGHYQLKIPLLAEAIPRQFENTEPSLIFPLLSKKHKLPQNHRRFQHKYRNKGGLSSKTFAIIKFKHHILYCASRYLVICFCLLSYSRKNLSLFCTLNTTNIYENGTLATSIKEHILPLNRFSHVLYVK